MHSGPHTADKVGLLSHVCSKSRCNSLCQLHALACIFAAKVCNKSRMFAHLICSAGWLDYQHWVNSRGGSLRTSMRVLHHQVGFKRVELGLL